MVKILENNDGNYYVVLLYEISKNSSKALLFKQYLFDEVLKELTRQEIMLISDSKGMKDAATQRVLMYLKLLNESDKIKEDIIKKTLKMVMKQGIMKLMMVQKLKLTSDIINLS